MCATPLPLVTILVTGYMSADAGDAKPDSGGSCGPLEGVSIRTPTNARPAEFVPETDILLKTVDIAGIGHNAGGLCMVELRNDFGERIVRRQLFDDAETEPGTANATTIQFDPGLPIAAGAPLQLSVGFTSFTACLYQFFLGYEAVN